MTALVFAALPWGSLGSRVVTLWIGAERTFVRERVSISAVTDMPGRKFSFSSTRIRTSNLVASCDCPPPPPPMPPTPESLDELAISVTIPLNLRSRKASTSSREFCAGLMSTTSISPISTRASISFKSDTIMISVPVIMAVPTTRSPSREFNLLTVPFNGDKMVVLASSSLARSNDALATST